MKLFLPLVLILAINTSAMTQPPAGNDDGQDAIAVARKLFAAMRSKDAVAIRTGQNDPVRAYRFQGWFINPNITETFKEIKERAAPK